MDHSSPPIRCRARADRPVAARMLATAVSVRRCCRASAIRPQTRTVTAPSPSRVEAAATSSPEVADSSTLSHHLVSTNSITLYIGETEQTGYPGQARYP